MCHSKTVLLISSTQQRNIFRRGYLFIFLHYICCTSCTESGQIMLSVGFCQIFCSYFHLSCGLINLNATSAAKCSVVHPAFVCSPCSCTQVSVAGDRNTNVCIFAIISLTCLNATVNFKIVNLFPHLFPLLCSPFSTENTHSHMHTNIAKIPWTHQSPSPFFLLHVIEVAARAGSQRRVVRFLLSTSLSALCAGTLFPSRTSFLTAHVVAPLPFNLLHRSPSLLLASHHFFVFTRPAFGQRKESAPGISCFMGLLITLRLTLFLAVLVIFVILCCQI